MSPQRPTSTAGIRRLSRGEVAAEAGGSGDGGFKILLEGAAGRRLIEDGTFLLIEGG